MSKKWSIILIAGAIAAVMLFSSCSRSASPLVLATQIPAGSSPTPQVTGLNVVQTWGTATAAYLQTSAAMGTAAPASATPQPSQVPTQATATSTSILPGTGVPTNTTGPVIATNTPMLELLR